MLCQGKVHKNGLENFWALFKRCIKGTYVSIEPFHLLRYSDAESSRFNNRQNTNSARFTMVVQSIGKRRLTYQALTGNEDERPDASSGRDAGSDIAGSPC